MKAGDAVQVLGYMLRNALHCTAVISDAAIVPLYQGGRRFQSAMQYAC